MEWKTREFRHMMMAMALLPMIKQYVDMKRRFDCGKTQMLRTARNTATVALSEED